LVKSIDWGKWPFCFVKPLLQAARSHDSPGQDAWATNGIDGRTRHMRKEALILAAALLCLNAIPGRSGAD
jgi:hypothetical protein